MTIRLATLAQIHQMGGTPPGEGGSGGTVADPTQLPAASGQTRVASTYGRNVAAGATYVDATTGTTILKLTSSSVPSSNSGIYHGYSSGGPVISQEWESGGVKYHTVWLQTGHFVDIRMDTFGTTNWRSAPATGELEGCFSCNTATPRIFYYLSGNTIVRYNTATNSAAPSGIFPKSIGSTGSSPTWLQTQLDDAWIVGMWNSNHTVFCVRTSDGYQRNFSSPQLGEVIDEPHIDRGLGYVYLSVDGTAPNCGLIANMETGAVVNLTGTNSTYPNDDHSDSLYGGLVCPGSWIPTPKAACLIHSDRSVTTRSYGGSSPIAWNGEFHTGAQWMIGQTDPDNSWYVVDNVSGGVAAVIEYHMIGYVNTGNSTARLICCGDNSGTGYNTGGQMHPTLSPDGKLMMWTSNMNGSGRYDVFVARIPTQSV